MRFYDVTLHISEASLPWPGDPPVRLHQRLALERGDAVNASEISITSHVGTHLDAPLHLLPSGASVDQIPLDALIGPVEVAQVSGAGAITASQLAALGLPADCRRLLLRTENSERGLLGRETFAADYCALSGEAGAWLAERRLWLVGIDAPSVDLFGAEDLPAHRALLEHGVAIVENVDLRSVPVGRYELLCLPLKLAGGDGAPARVVLLRR